MTAILVPLDGSPLSESALPYAVRFAGTGGTRLVLARIVAGVPSQLERKAAGDNPRIEDARVYLEQLALELRNSSLSVDTVALGGDPSTELLNLASTVSAELIVMATHGRSGFGRWIYGSVADEVLRHASTPVVLVPGESLPPWRAARAPKILVPLDGSESSEAIFQPLQRLAALRGSELVLLEVMEWPPSVLPMYDGGYYDFDPERDLEPCRTYLNEVAQRLQPSIASVVPRAELGRMPLRILEVAQQEQVDLIAMTTHGRSGIGRIVLGGTATGVVQGADTPVLLMRPQAVPETAAPTGEPPTERTLSVRLTRSELVLIQRGLNVLLHGPTADIGKQAAIEQLRDRCRQQDAAYTVPG